MLHEIKKPNQSKIDDDITVYLYVWIHQYITYEIDVTNSSKFTNELILKFITSAVVYLNSIIFKWFTFKMIATWTNLIDWYIKSILEEGNT